MDVLMPQLGETVDSGTVTAWLKKPGEPVTADEPLFEVETEKVATEIPAPCSGILLSVLVPAGESVPVGTRLAVIESNASAASAGEHRLSPVVRRLVAEHGLDISSVQGSGTEGRISREDVLAHLARQGRGAAASPPSKPPAELRAFTSLRKRIAEHMVRSKATSPHVLQAVETDFHRVAAIRSVVGQRWRETEGFSLTYLPFIAWAVCRAIREFPLINATIEGDGLRVHPHVNLSIAIDLDFAGLLAPVISNSERMSVAELARTIHDLSSRARSNRLSPDEMTDGTYTLSNSGSFGTLITAPIINQPQVAILSTDGIRKKAVVIETNGTETIVARPVGVLAQSFDHRAFDGAYSASFLRAVRQSIEDTAWSTELVPQQ